MVINDIIFNQGSHSDWKTWKMARNFPVREKSGNFDQTGKVREITQNTGKLGEFHTGKVRNFVSPEIQCVLDKTKFVLELIS